MPKLILEGTELDIRPSDAQAVAHYIVELDADTQGNPLAPLNLPGANNLGAAQLTLPAIGSSQDFNAVQGAPLVDGTGSAAPGVVQGAQFVTHTLRVSRHRIYTGGTGNGNKLHADVFYSSKPRPVIELGSSAVQQKTQTYLSDSTSVVTPQNSFMLRQQMVLDYIQKAGSMIGAKTDTSSNLTSAWPPTDIAWLKTPAEGSMFRFGTSLRISSWWYNDEATIKDFSEMAQLYVAATNNGPFLFANDDQQWLCTSLPTLTNDGAWMTRVTGEFVYSPFGWDSYQVYTDPFTNAPAMLSQDVINALYTRGVVNSYGVPSPYPSSPATDRQSGNGAGAGRFPQQVCRPMLKLLGFISQGILADLVPASELERILNQTGGPAFDAIPIPDNGMPLT